MAARVEGAAQPSMLVAPGVAGLASVGGEGRGEQQRKTRSGGLGMQVAGAGGVGVVE